jgi:hypothetical protein
VGLKLFQVSLDKIVTDPKGNMRLRLLTFHSIELQTSDISLFNNRYRALSTSIITLSCYGLIL